MRLWRVSIQMRGEIRKHVRTCCTFPSVYISPEDVCSDHGTLLVIFGLSGRFLIMKQFANGIAEKQIKLHSWKLNLDGLGKRIPCLWLINWGPSMPCSENKFGIWATALVPYHALTVVDVACELTFPISLHSFAMSCFSVLCIEWLQALCSWF